MKKVKLFEQFINEGTFVVWYEDQEGKHQVIIAKPNHSTNSPNKLGQEIHRNKKP